MKITNIYLVHDAKTWSTGEKPPAWFNAQFSGIELREWLNAGVAA